MKTEASSQDEMKELQFSLDFEEDRKTADIRTLDWMVGDWLMKDQTQVISYGELIARYHKIHRTLFDDIRNARKMREEGAQ